MVTRALWAAHARGAPVFSVVWPARRRGRRRSMRLPGRPSPLMTTPGASPDLARPELPGRIPRPGEVMQSLLITAVRCRQPGDRAGGGRRPGLVADEPTWADLGRRLMPGRWS